MNLRPSAASAVSRISGSVHSSLSGRASTFWPMRLSHMSKFSLACAAFDGCIEHQVQLSSHGGSSISVPTSIVSSVGALPERANAGAQAGQDVAPETGKNKIRLLVTNAAMELIIIHAAIVVWYGGWEYMDCTVSECGAESPWPGEKDTKRNFALICVGISLLILTDMLLVCASIHGVLGLERVFWARLDTAGEPVKQIMQTVRVLINMIGQLLVFVGAYDYFAYCTWGYREERDWWYMIAGLLVEVPLTCLGNNLTVTSVRVTVAMRGILASVILVADSALCVGMWDLQAYWLWGNKETGMAPQEALWIYGVIGLAGLYIGPLCIAQELLFGVPFIFMAAFSGCLHFNAAYNLLYYTPLGAGTGYDNHADTGVLQLCMVLGLLVLAVAGLLRPKSLELGSFSSGTSVSHAPPAEPAEQQQRHEPILANRQQRLLD